MVVPTTTSFVMLRLQEELKKRALDAKWTPLKGKKELVDRLQVLSGASPRFRMPVRIARLTRQQTFRHLTHPMI
jgi:hypothetical protein